jgi:N-acetylmuramoyl-L-alanine amidase
MLGSIIILAAGSLVAVNASDPRKQACLGTTRENFRILIDVGHTPKEPGAISARGVTEYFYNGRLAERVQEELKSAGFTSTRVMKIETPGPAGLKQRPDSANKWPANLFLSLHHDSAQPHYFLPWQFNGKEQLYADQFSGYSLFVSKQNGAFGESLRFATALADQLLRSGRQFSSHHNADEPGERRAFIDPSRGIYVDDMLAVLRLTKMPAVLVETGVIVNRQEEEWVTSPGFRDFMARVITEAVVKFCGGASAPQ